MSSDQLIRLTELISKQLILGEMYLNPETFPGIFHKYLSKKEKKLKIQNMPLIYTLYTTITFQRFLEK